MSQDLLVQKPPKQDSIPEGRLKDSLDGAGEPSNPEKEEPVFGPEEAPEAPPSEIEIIHGGDFFRNEAKYPQASLFLNDGEQVQFKHEDINLWCDFALFYKEKNLLRASGNIRLLQGDTVQMTSRYLEYDGNTRKALSRNQVELKTPKATLSTDTLHYDRISQQAFYSHYGTLRDSTNTLVSKNGIYYLDKQKVRFEKEVVMTNKDFVMNSELLFYYPNTKHVYFYGPTHGKGKNYKTYAERGFYDTQAREGYLLKKARVDNEARTVFGDSIYYDDLKKYVSVTNHVKVIDTVNKSIVKGHYAEVFKDKDSIIITKMPVAITLQEKDSLFIHSDTMTITGKDKERIVKMYHKVKMFGPMLSGRSDSLISTEKDGVAKLLKDPILWYKANQITGDQMHLTFDPKTKKLDSLKVLDNTFIIAQDTLHREDFNQIKGKDLYGKIIEGEFKTVDIIKNCEVIYYIYDKKKDLIGINKTSSDEINVVFEKKQIYEVTCKTNAVGDIYPEFDLPLNARKLKDFKWRGKEQIPNKDSLFTPEERAIKLPVIKGLDTLDIDAREYEYTKAAKLQELKRRQILRDSLAALSKSKEDEGPPADSLSVKPQTPEKDSLASKDSLLSKKVKDFVKKRKIGPERLLTEQEENIRARLLKKRAKLKIDLSEINGQITALNEKMHPKKPAPPPPPVKPKAPDSIKAGAVDSLTVKIPDSLPEKPTPLSGADTLLRNKDYLKKAYTKTDKQHYDLVYESRSLSSKIQTLDRRIASLGVSKDSLEEVQENRWKTFTIEKLEQEKPLQKRESKLKEKLSKLSGKTEFIDLIESQSKATGAKDSIDELFAMADKAFLAEVKDESKKNFKKQKRLKRELQDLKVELENIGKFKDSLKRYQAKLDSVRVADSIRKDSLKKAKLKPPPAKSNEQTPDSIPQISQDSIPPANKPLDSIQKTNKSPDSIPTGKPIDSIQKTNKPLDSIPVPTKPIDSIRKTNKPLDSIPVPTRPIDSIPPANQPKKEEKSTD